MSTRFAGGLRWRALLAVVGLAGVGCSSKASGPGGDGGAADGGGSSGGDARDVGTGGSDTADGGGVAGTIVRTLVYHQVSALTGSPTGPAFISADGSKIVYPVAPGTGDPATPNRIFVVNPDGTGTLEVDSYVPRTYSGATLAISADGRTIVSTDSTQVRVVGADASKKGSLTFDSNEVSHLAISADGSTVFMLQRRNNGLAAAPIERGLWAMNADGSNHRQLVGPAAIASLLGTTPDMVFPFAGCGKSLEVSASGQRIVIAVAVGGMEFAFAVEGNTPRKLKGPVAFVKQVAISSDGNTVAATTYSPEEVAVMDWSGSGSRVVTTLGQSSCFSAMTLNADGSQVLLGELALLFPRAGGDPVPLYLLTAGDGFALGGPWRDSYPGFSMTGDARRFVYQNFDDAVPNVFQIARLELNPSGAGGAPSVASPWLTVGSIPRDRSVGAGVSCAISGGGTLLRAGTAVLLHGQEDRAGSWISGQKVLRDDGMGGDRTATDGVFTSEPSITSGTGGEVGPRLIRTKAESKDGSGRRHATAIDFSGLEVR